MNGVCLPETAGGLWPIYIYVCICLCVCVCVVMCNALPLTRLSMKDPLICMCTLLLCFFFPAHTPLNIYLLFEVESSVPVMQ